MLLHNVRSRYQRLYVWNDPVVAKYEKSNVDAQCADVYSGSGRTDFG
jgi:hypothetical protein